MNKLPWRRSIDEKVAGDERETGRGVERPSTLPTDKKASKENHLHPGTLFRQAPHGNVNASELARTYGGRPQTYVT
jgi:hypothetical protein